MLSKEEVKRAVEVLSFGLVSVMLTAKASWVQRFSGCKSVLVWLSRNHGFESGVREDEACALVLCKLKHIYEWELELPLPLYDYCADKDG